MSAHVRRTRAFLGLAIATLLSTLAAILVVSVNGSKPSSLTTSPAPLPSRPSRQPAQTHALSLEQQIGQHLIGRMMGTTPSASLLRRIRRGQLGGVIFFGENIPNAATLARTINILSGAARAGGQPPLLFATDQEGGLVKRLPLGPPFKSPADMGASDSPARARTRGIATGRYLRRARVNVDLAPVLDAPSSPTSFLGSRAFSGNPAVVTRIGVPFASGIQAGGVAAAAKHFPGLGTAPANTDLSDVTILTSRAELLRRLVPFAAAVQSGIRLVMVSNARYPALDEARNPAVVSRPIVTGILRGRLGFRGVVISDTLAAPSLRGYRQVPLKALNAGVDVLLYSDSEKESAYAYALLLRDARTGLLSRSLLKRSGARIAALKMWIAKNT